MNVKVDVFDSMLYNCVIKILKLLMYPVFGYFLEKDLLCRTICCFIK